jgi:uncharacterized protein
VAGTCASRGQGGRLSDVLLVFLKDPRPGAVKTRLARDIGDVLAARLYRALAEAEVSRTAPRGDAYERLFCFAPPDAGASLAAWFPGETWRPQCVGDLGERLTDAFAAAFARGARRVCVIGTDVPWVDRATIEDAFQSLDDQDLVLGPASDGGYYLLALAQPRPPLFRGIAWSTSSVLASTVERAAGLGMAVRLLPVLPDIDTADDVRVHWGRLRTLLDDALAAQVAAALGV